jgi:hypothetical protein
MSGPSLPDTDDPWVLLEVDRDAAPEVVRRAYLAKIKVHKPDRAPEAFRRIREAYEAIAAGLPRAPAPRHATPASSIAPDEPATHAAHGADATPEPDAAPRPSPYLDTDALDALLADRRTDELFVALQAGRIDPRHVMAVVHVLATLSVLVDGAAFDRLVAAFPAEVRELAGRDSVFALRLAAGPAIARWVSEGEAPCPALLAVLVELPIADDTRCRALTRDLANSVRGDPAGTLAALDRIAAAGVEGPAIVTEVLEEIAGSIPDEVRDRRMLQLNAAGFAHRIDRERSGDRRLGAEGFAAAFGSFAILSVLVNIGVPMVGVCIGLALAWVVLYVMYDASASFYRRKLRSRLIEQVWNHPVPSRLILDQLRTFECTRPANRDAFSSDAFDKYVVLVDRDLALQAFADLTWIAWAVVTLDAPDEPPVEPGVQA